MPSDPSYLFTAIPNLSDQPDDLTKQAIKRLAAETEALTQNTILRCKYARKVMH